MSEKSNIVFCGMPSSGKSTIGKIVAEKLNSVFIDTDAEIVRLEGCSIPEIFSNKGEEYFRQVESRVVERVAKLQGVVIALGGGAVLNTNSVAALKNGGKIFFLDRAPELLTPTADRPLSSNADALMAIYNKRYPIYKKVSDYCVENNGSVDDVLKKIYELI